MPSFSAGSASVQIVPDFSGAQRKIGQWFAQQGDMNVGVKADLNRSSLQAVQTQINATNSKINVDVDIKNLERKFLAFLDGASGLSSIENAFKRIFGPRSILMTSGVGAFTALAAAASTALPVIGLLPAAIMAAAGPIAALTIGVQGVGEAFKALGAADQASAADAAAASAAREAAAAKVASAQKQVESAAAGVENAHRQVEDALRGVEDAERKVADAERGVADAQAKSRQAQEDLNAARDAAIRNLADMNRELARSALDEEGAVLSVERAKERLTATTAEGSKASELDRREADLGYRKALESLEEIRLRNKRLAEETAEANRAGVEGSDQVVAAKERVATAAQGEQDAARKLADAQRGVADAQRTVADAQKTSAEASEALGEAQLALAAATTAASSAGAGASDAQSKAAEAMAKLAPSAQAFVQTIRGLQGAWDDLKKTVQENLFAGLSGTISTLADRQLPTLATGLAGIAAELNSGFRNSMAVFSSTAAVNDFATTLENIRLAWKNLADAAAPITQIFIDLTTVGSSFLPQLTAGIGGAAAKFAEFIGHLRETGRLAEIFQTALDVLGQLFSIVGNVGSAVGSIFQAALPAGGELLTLLDTVTGSLAAFLGTDVAQSSLTTFFDQIVGALGILTPAFDALTQAAVTGLLPAISGLALAIAPVVNTVLVQFADMVNQLAPIIYPVLAQAITAMLSALAPLIPIITEMALALFPVLADILVQLAPVISAFAEAVGEGMLTTFQAFLPLLLPVVEALTWFLDLVTPLMPYLVTFGATMWILVKAFEAFKLVLAAVSFIMNIGILGIIALVIAGLVALWVNSETFRDIVKGALEAVGNAAMWMWENAIKPAWDGIMAAWDALVTGLSWAWENILKPVFDVIGTVLQTLGIIAMVVVFGPMLLAWKLLVLGIEAAWKYVLKPVWEAIETAARWLWENALKPIFEFIGWYWGLIFDGMAWAWKNVLKPVWDAIQTAASWLWDNALKPIFDAIGKAWEGLASAFGWVYDTLIKPIFDAFGDVIGVLRDGFQTGVDAIVTIWEGLKDALMGPVQWVIDFVWNDGLLKLWNTINNLWGGQDLDPFRLDGGGSSSKGASGPSLRDARFATGGVLPGYTPGEDVHHFFSPTGGRLSLSGGEAVMRPEFTAAMGVHGINMLNAAARSGGVQAVANLLAGRQAYDQRNGQSQRFAKGGVIDIPGWLSWIPGLDGVADIVNKINGGDGWGGGLFGDGLMGTITNASKQIWDWVKSWWDGEGDGTGFKSPGSSPRGIGGLGPKAAAARKFVQDTWHISNVGGYANRNIAGTNTPSDHALGKAIDVMLTPDYNSPAKRQLGNTVANWFVQHPEKYGTRYVIYYDRINEGRGWKPYRHPGGGRSDTLQHRDHVHTSFYDRGGYLPPGMTTVMNATGRPEPVLTASEHDSLLRWRGFERSRAEAAQSSIAGFVNHGTVLTVDVDEIARKTRRGTQRALAVAGL